MDTVEKWEMEILERDVRASKQIQSFHKWEVTWNNMMGNKRWAEKRNLTAALSTANN